MICKKGELDIYLYPKLELSDSEKVIAVIFMVVGQTGSGKTTLLNSFLNYYLGIQIDDDFRYEMIHESFGTSQSISQTSDVIIYNIKGANGFPPVIWLRC